LANRHAEFGKICRGKLWFLYMTATRALTGGMLKILSCAYWVDRLFIHQLQLPATNTVVFWGFRRLSKINYYMWKIAAVSRGIWQTGPRNLDKFSVEISGP